MLKDKQSIGFHLMNNKRMTNEVYYSGPPATLIYTVCPLCRGIMAECQEWDLVPIEEAWKGWSAGGSLGKDAASFRKMSQILILAWLNKWMKLGEINNVH